MSNLGYVHLQLARQHMSSSLAYEFWMPSLLEIESGLPPTDTRTLSEDLNTGVMEELNVAVQLLEKSKVMDNTNRLARINLITAYLYLGNY